MNKKETARNNSLIYQVGIIRSGSTLIYQILKHVFKNSRINKQHHFPYPLDFPVVATYRDFRDILVSAWRTFVISREGEYFLKSSMKHNKRYKSL